MLLLSCHIKYRVVPRIVFDSDFLSFGFGFSQEMSYLEHANHYDRVILLVFLSEKRSISLLKNE